MFYHEKDHFLLELLSHTDYIYMDAFVVPMENDISLER